MWCGDQHRTGEWHRLGKGELCVGCSRRKVNNKIIKVAPLNVTQELLDRTANERAAPNNRLTLWDEELDRDQLHTVTLNRFNLSTRARLRRAGCTEHLRKVWSGDICIKQSDARAALRQRNGEIDGDGALPYAAFARRYGDDIANVR